MNYNTKQAVSVLTLASSIPFHCLNIIYSRLGWDPKEGESHLDSMLRGEILVALAKLGHDLTLNEANRRFHAFVDDRNTPLLPPDIRKVVKQYSIKYQCSSTYEPIMSWIMVAGSICGSNAESQLFK